MFKKTTLSSALILGMSASTDASSVPVTYTKVVPAQYAPETTVVAKYEAQSHTYITPRLTGFINSQLHPDGKFVQKLQGPGGSTQSDLENAQAELDSAKAALDLTMINVKKAKYDLGSTIITAPYDGKLGKSNVSIGDYVSPASGSLIDIVSQTPMNVTFNVDLNTFKEFSLESDSQSTIQLSDIDQPANVDFVSNSVNPTAGTVEISAEFDNHEFGVKPNSVTHVTLRKKNTTQGYWLPETAVIQDLTLQYVYIIDENETAQRRNVTILERDSGKVFVSEGLENDDKVITDGLIRVRPNTKVIIKAGE